MVARALFAGLCAAVWAKAYAAAMGMAPVLVVPVVIGAGLVAALLHDD